MGGGNCFREKLKRQRASASGREFVFVINHTHPRTQRKTNWGASSFFNQNELNLNALISQLVHARYKLQRYANKKYSNYKHSIN